MHDPVSILLLALLLYILPTLIACLRNHHQAAAIFIVNLFLGWTFIGWVVALAMSMTAAKFVGRD